jgi:hypothetical protein
MFDDVRAYLEMLSLPQGDANDLPTSKRRFQDNAHYRIEIALINSIHAFRSLVHRAKELDLKINRVTETRGIFRHTDEELRAYLKLGEQEGIEIVFSVGPRATYDTGAQRAFSHGAFVGYRLRGMEQILRAVEDVRHIAELGGRSVVVYDEGLLWVLNRMRLDKFIPENMRFKASAHMGHCNPASVRLLEALGADSINPIRDLPLNVIAALRKTIHIPLDVHTDNPPSSGGFIRSYEAPEIVRVAAPVYLKMGTSEVAAHGQRTEADDGYRMAEHASIVRDMMVRYYPEACQSEPGSYLCDETRQESSPLLI